MTLDTVNNPGITVRLGGPVWGVGHKLSERCKSVFQLNLSGINVKWLKTRYKPTSGITRELTLFNTDQQ